MEVLIVAAHLQAMVVVFCGVVQAVVGTRAGYNDVWRLAPRKAIEQLAVIVLRAAPSTPEVLHSMGACQ